MSVNYDLIVIGSGPAGQRAAVAASKMNKRVAVVEARAVVGNTLFKMGKFPEAEAEYQKALALEPGNALLRDRLSIAHARAQGAPARKAGKEP